MVSGKGTNQFGIFHINGTAAPSGVDGDPTFNVVLRKRYEAQPVVVPATSAESAVPPSSNHQPPAASAAAGLPLPPPSKSFPSGVVCLRGKLFKEESNDLGVTEVVHRINGSWAAGLDIFNSDPENLRKLQNRFEYEHKSSTPSTTAFPVSGRYSGWFDLGNEDGTRTRINERDVTLKFRKNSAGYYNVEGKGSNVFGKYNITGTLENETITIFRHFLPRKPKIKTVDGSTALSTVVPASSAGAGSVAPSAGSIASGAASVPGASSLNSRRPSALAPPFEPKFKLSDVPVPQDAESSDGKLEPTKLPANGAYSAVSRGVLRLNDDGSHSCQGKWAVTREHFTNGATSNFNFRLESHLASAAAAASGDRTFPLDSEMYKGSFQLKKQGTRHQTIVDQQLVLKFRMNSQGAYNVYGKGVNAIGEFNLVGTLVMSGKTGGQVELYRMYPPEKLAALPGPKVAAPGAVASTAGAMPKPDVVARAMSFSQLPGPPLPSSLQRRESTRLVKLPSKLEDDDPTAIITRAMSKCSQILQFMREKDAEMGGFFSEPVDPVALGIPTYHQIIKEPMDLRTIHRRMEAESIGTPDEFARLCRLVFENAMNFNIDPAHSVHQAARSLLVLFNQKFRDVERLVQNVRGDEKGKKKLKEDKKRKRQTEEVKSPKKRRLEEAQAMATANASAVAAIVAAAPLVSTQHVTRPEFNMLLNMIQELQRQVVATHTAVAELSPGDEGENDAMSVVSGLNPASVASAVPSTVAQQPPPERKKAVKRKSEAAVTAESASAAASTAAAAAALDDSRPLTLDEQELLTETINDLPPEHLGGVIQIIREAAPVGADEDEIDLEIDQLDTKTQRKLLRHVLKVRQAPPLFVVVSRFRFPV
jgi:Bromodomain extra-terminal - transcription regulation/Bromodomain